MTTRRPFSAPVQREITDRATDAKGIIRCEGCGMDMTGKLIELDHIIAEALVPEWKKFDERGKIIPLTAKDGQLLGECCHRGEDGKTRKDVKAAAKEKRQNAKYTGAKRYKQNIKSRGFDKVEKTAKIDKEAIAKAAVPATGGIAARYGK